MGDNAGEEPGAERARMLAEVNADFAAGFNLVRRAATGAVREASDKDVVGLARRLEQAGAINPGGPVPLFTTGEAWMKQAQDDAEMKVQEMRNALHAIPSMDYYTPWAAAKKAESNIAVQMSRMQPEFLKRIQHDIQQKYKQMIFLDGKRVKEGKRRYPESVLRKMETDPAFRETMSLNKDTFKAYIIMKMYNAKWADGRDINRSHFSSKGFHQLFFGRPQKKNYNLRKGKMHQQV